METTPGTRLKDWARRVILRGYNKRIEWHSRYKDGNYNIEGVRRRE